MSEPDEFSVSGHRVLVTGSSKGLGEGIAAYLARCGAHVAVHGRNADRTAAVAASIRDAGGVATAVVGDIRDPDRASDVVSSAAHELGGLDGLVNNAGGAFAAPATEMSANGFSAVVSINLTATFLVARAAHPYLAASHGAIVNISSLAAIRPAPLLAHYAAAKAAVLSLTASLAAEWSPQRIRVNAIVPGLMATPAALETNFGNDPERIAEAEARIGVGRMGTADDVAMTCRYLLSSASGFVNGATIVLDGGPDDSYVV